MPYGQQPEPKMPTHSMTAHHSFKAQHHAKLAKLHQEAFMHHQKMAGSESESEDPVDESSDIMTNKTMPMSFGRGA